MPTALLFRTVMLSPVYHPHCPGLNISIMFVNNLHDCPFIVTNIIHLFSVVLMRKIVCKIKFITRIYRWCRKVKFKLNGNTRSSHKKRSE